MIPSGLIQSPVYNPEWPQSHLYGVLGQILAMEIAPSLEGDGNKYGEFGEQRMIFDEVTMRKLKDYAECLSQQYAHIASNMSHMPAENVGDHSGELVRVKVQSSKIL